MVIQTKKIFLLKHIFNSTPAALKYLNTAYPNIWFSKLAPMKAVWNSLQSSQDQQTILQLLNVVKNNILKVRGSSDK